MLRILSFLLAALALFAAGAYMHREAIALSWRAAAIERAPLEQRMALLSPAMRYFPPSRSEGRAPAVILFHGCAGLRPDFMKQWAAAANEEGWLAVTVDSNAPRGIDRARGLSSVCKGAELIGQERAGDVLAAYEIVRRRKDVDPRRIVLAGWSHGAWSVMDLIALAPPRRLPAGIAPEGVTAPRIAGAILVYPYCGPGAWSRVDGWDKPPPVLALVGGADSVVEADQCLRLFEKLGANGADIELAYYPEADHVFDDPFLAPEHRHMYDADAHEDAEKRFRRFLRETGPRAN